MTTNEEILKTIKQQEKVIEVVRKELKEKELALDEEYNKALEDVFEVMINYANDELGGEIREIEILRKVYKNIEQLKKK